MSWPSAAKRASLPDVTSRRFGFFSLGIGMMLAAACSHNKHNAAPAASAAPALPVLVPPPAKPSTLWLTGWVQGMPLVLAEARGWLAGDPQALAKLNQPTGLDLQAPVWGACTIGGSTGDDEFKKTPRCVLAATVSDLQTFVRATNSQGPAPTTLASGQQRWGNGNFFCDAWPSTPARVACGVGAHASQALDELSAYAALSLAATPLEAAQGLAVDVHVEPEPWRAHYRGALATMSAAVPAVVQEALPDAWSDPAKQAAAKILAAFANEMVIHLTHIESLDASLQIDPLHDNFRARWAIGEANNTSLIGKFIARAAALPATLPPPAFVDLPASSEKAHYSQSALDEEFLRALSDFFVNVTVLAREQKFQRKTLSALEKFTALIPSLVTHRWATGAQILNSAGDEDPDDVIGPLLGASGTTFLSKMPEHPVHGSSLELLAALYNEPAVARWLTDLSGQPVNLPRASLRRASARDGLPANAQWLEFPLPAWAIDHLQGLNAVPTAIAELLHGLESGTSPPQAQQPDLGPAQSGAKANRKRKSSLWFLSYSRDSVHHLHVGGDRKAILRAVTSAQQPTHKLGEAFDVRRFALQPGLLAAYVTQATRQRDDALALLRRFSQSPSFRALLQQAPAAKWQNSMTLQASAAGDRLSIAGDVHGSILGLMTFSLGKYLPPATAWSTSAPISTPTSSTANDDAQTSADFSGKSPQTSSGAAHETQHPL